MGESMIDLLRENAELRHRCIELEKCLIEWNAVMEVTLHDLKDSHLADWTRRLLFYTGTPDASWRAHTSEE
jgi:hypothetical protein